MIGNIQKLVLGNGLGQGLQLLALLVFSRIYLPGDFGLLAQVQSIATLACIVATLQLHLTIPLVGNDDEARAAAQAVQSLCIAVCLLALPLAVYLGKIFIFALALTLILGLANTYNSYLVSKGSFGQMSGFFVVRAVLIVGLQLAFALLSVDDGLLWGLVLAEALATIYLRLAHLGPVHPLRMRVRKALEMAGSLKSFSIFGTIQELMSVCAFYAPLLLFASDFGESTGGQYAMASRLVWAPVVLLSGSLAQVLYHRFGKAPPTTLRSVCEPVFGTRLLVGLLAACALAFALQDAILWALGPQWDMASRMLPLHLLWGTVFLLSTPFRVTCRVLHLQRYQLTVDTGMLLAIVLLFAVWTAGPVGLMWGLVAIAMGQNGLLATAVWRRFRRPAVGPQA